MFFRKRILNNGYELLEDVLPKGFKYPKSFLQLIDIENIKDVPYPEPIYFLGEFPKSVKQWDKNIKKQYPTRILVPFAKNENTDDVFCFDGTDTSGNPKVYIVHTFASPGWEDRGSYKNFDEWYEDIQEFSREYNKENDE